MKIIPHAQVTPALTSKVCLTCQELKPLTEFNTNRARKDGLCTRCIPCDRANQTARRNASLTQYRAAQRRWASTNQGKVSKRYKRWYSTHTDEALIRNHNQRAQKCGAEGTFTYHEWQQLKAKYGNRCLYCFRVEGEIVLSMDHIVPLSKSGSNFIHNIQPLCMSCNSSKRDKHICYRPDKLLSF